MAEFALRQGTWVAVCDGRKALLFENEGDHAYPNLRMIETRAQDNPATHEQGSAPPGRTFSAAGGRHAAVQDTDFHDEAERHFLKDFAALLDRRVRAEPGHDLILVAPARALGMIRPVLSAAARAVLVAELDRDYVKMPSFEIEKRLKEMHR